jgi:hypothetical protein
MPEEIDREVERLLNEAYEQTLEYVRRELGLTEIAQDIRDAVYEGRAREVARRAPPLELEAPPETDDCASRSARQWVGRKAAAHESPELPAHPAPAALPTRGTMFDIVDLPTESCAVRPAVP